MKLTIAGGCLEHGRNSFLLEGFHYSLLLDCGITGDGKMPLLNEEQIKKIDYCLLSHCHKDHTGAMDWLLSKGFDGTFLMTRSTYHELSNPLVHVKFLNEHKENILADDLKMTCFASGHTEGSIATLIEIESRAVFFSGDFNPQATYYPLQLPMHQSADLAILDCTYGNQTIVQEEVMDKIKNWITHHGGIKILPVPRFGRGQEFEKYLHTLNPLLTSSLEGIGYHELILLQDAQIKSKENQAWIQSHESSILFTGHLDKNSFALELVDNAKAEHCLYPVHCGYQDVQKCCAQNHFEQVILNHCATPIHHEDHPEILDVKTGDTLEF